MVDHSERDRLHRRYQQASNEELLELWQSGQESFTDQAWELLTAEIGGRELEIPEDTLSAGSPLGSTGPVPLDGWLLGFTLWTAVGLLVSAPWMGALLKQALATGDSVSWFPFGFGFSVGIAHAIGFHLIVKRHPTTRLYWVWVCSATACVTALPALFAVSYGARPHLRLLFAGAVSVGWAIYWHRSTRVRRTFARSDGPVKASSHGIRKQPMMA